MTRTAAAPVAGAIPAAERGATRIADRVVAKIAARAAREALAEPPEEGREPHATVDVRDGSARVRIGMELTYPSDIGAQCASVRRQVASRVGELAGMTVSEVTVLVERLHRVAPESGRMR
ncbi:hypothetical protein GCM10010329_09460 [Streptomyces spiroverticillatus]|uniref:Asp23/Gls24 family envelope stress response protein n=1 Tax=Streptomyces finlayi TaxID=67296 RepID=A0A918WY40_9ACTN|nr:alkaline shock response membrane anchor protein AmaP [Streptomyces finlayi]GGZ91276.1 hypothetical protein GCM10010329_09460 [Streptomyces spiroverticillatus]GHC93944.1 hypothetical protein GCM10010334_31620 [Streptomyces finlayi]